MSDRIYVTYTPTSFPDAFHTAIHYERRDEDRKLVRHYVIEVQPEAQGLGNKAIGVIEEAFRNGDEVTRLGRMKARVLDITDFDPRPDADPSPPYEVIAEGDDLSPHLARMQLYAHGVSSAGIAYRGGHQNSNSFASGALKAGELPTATGVGHDPSGPAGELLEFFAPGLNEALNAPIGRRSTNFKSQEFEEAPAPTKDFRYLSRKQQSSVDPNPAAPAYLGELQQYLRVMDANRAAGTSRSVARGSLSLLNPVPMNANASGPFASGGQFVPGSATSSRPLYETRSFIPPSEEAVPADNGKDIRRLVRLPTRKESLAGFDPNAPVAMPNEIPAAGRPTSFADRFGNWSSFSGVSAPIAPNQPVAPPPQASRPLGLLTGKPMPDYPFPPPIFGFRASRPGPVTKIGLGAWFDAPNGTRRRGSAD